MSPAPEARKIAIAHPFVPEEAIEAVAQVLRSKFIGQGELVDEFERRFESHFSIPRGHAVAVSSGTAALELAYDLLGLKNDSVVITTPLSCTATNIPLVRRGCHLLFADISRETLNIDPASIVKVMEAAQKEDVTVSAIINVHLHGVMSFLPLSRVPDYAGVSIVDDSAQAFAPPLPYRRFTAYSFQAIKPLTTGDGGMLVCASLEDAREAKLRRWFGIDRSLKLANNWQPFKERKILFDIRYPGYKMQMTNISAAIGLAGLAKIHETMDHRRAIYDVYRKAQLPLVDPHSDAAEGMAYWYRQNYFGYACLLVENRDQFCERMAQAGIETNVMQVRNDLYEIFKPFARPLPNMDWVAERHICIPLHNHMTLDDAQYVAEKAKEALQ